MYTPGQVIGNYRVLAKIGTGGMGSVYLAEHPLIGKKVALKVIHKELAGNREVLQRFFQEARAVGMIGNEHIIEIHDFGQSPEGDHFIIMEYLEGQTLAQALVREGRLATTRALHIAAQIATALAAAHGAGIIHRDLKPDNIMLTSRLGDPEFVKVLDFGLAKVLESSAQLTAVGVVLGTPQYMSPEACESKRPVDHRTDIYALGILLFQMVTGQLPFDGQSMGEVMVKQVTQLPPGPRGLTPEVPPAVEQIILRCLAKQPDLRFPTMLALRDALVNPDAYLVGSPLPMPARSVPPGSAGVDARTVMAYAAQHQPAAAPGARAAAGAGALDVEPGDHALRRRAAGGPGRGQRGRPADRQRAHPDRRAAEPDHGAGRPGRAAGGAAPDRPVAGARPDDRGGGGGDGPRAVVVEPARGRRRIGIHGDRHRRTGSAGHVGRRRRVGPGGGRRGRGRRRGAGARADGRRRGWGAGGGRGPAARRRRPGDGHRRCGRRWPGCADGPALRPEPAGRGAGPRRWRRGAGQDPIPARGAGRSSRARVAPGRPPHHAALARRHRRAVRGDDDAAAAQPAPRRRQDRSGPGGDGLLDPNDL